MEQNTKNGKLSQQGTKYTYEKFLDIIETLRSENGCPWDREQTHMSLRPCMMEEAAEVMAGIRTYDTTGNYENLREELGDVLLQVVMHAQIAKEEGIFTMEDVVNEVAEKMVRRHPHVFGDVNVNGSGQVLENWEEIKKKEKQGKNLEISPLREIPSELPSLAKATKILKKADKLYEPGKSYEASVEELRLAVDKLSALTPADYDPRITETVGDMLMALSNISRICRLSPEQILTDRTEDVINRYEKRA
ncbi:MAG: MazG family protein [Acetatifactor sp.]|nr:MazG family protein [Acetatifactor sp.]